MEPPGPVHVLGLKQLQVRRCLKDLGGHERDGRWQVQCIKLTELIKEMDAVSSTVQQGYQATGGHERGGHWQAQYILDGVGKLREVMKEMDAGRYDSASS